MKVGRFKQQNIKEGQKRNRYFHFSPGIFKYFCLQEVGQIGKYS